MSRQASPAQPAPQSAQQLSYPQHPSHLQHPHEHSRHARSPLDTPMSAGAGPTFIVGMPPQQVQPSASTSSSRGKGKAYSSGITASAEDVKYAAKYRDLKKKVKEIEADNDKLLFKVLQAKRNIQRAKLERAILYERLSTVPASPPQSHAALPPHSLPGPLGPTHGVVPAISPHGLLPPQVAHGAPYEQQLPDVRHHHRHELQHGPPGPAPLLPPDRRSRVTRDPAYSRKRPHHEIAYGGSPPPSPPPTHGPPPGHLPITHTPRTISIRTADGAIQVVADIDGRPVLTAEGDYIPVDPNPPPPPASSGRRRSGRSAREPIDIEPRAREQAILPGPGPAPPTLQPPHSTSTSRPHSAGGPLPPLGGQVSPPISNARAHGQAAHTVHHVPLIAPREAAAARERELELQREYEHDREIRDREREKQERLELRERERGRQAHAHIHGHGHGQHPGEPIAPSVERERSRRHDLRELAGSPPPPPNNAPVNRGEPSLPSPSQVSPIQGHAHAHRSHSMHSHHSHHSYHSHGHRSHSHSHSNSPMNSPTDSRPFQPPNNMRIHGHQRIGPGTNINRDRDVRERERDVENEREDQASPPVPSTPTGAPPGPGPASTSSRVPTPPYMRTSTVTGVAINAGGPPSRENDDRDVEMDTAAEPLPSSARPSSRVSSLMNASPDSTDDGTPQERGPSGTPS